MFDFLLIIFSYILSFYTNPIYGLLILILCFLFAAWNMILMNATFLALIFIIIYVGAIAVLFLFVIMMLNIKEESSSFLTEERTSRVHEIVWDFLHFFVLSFVLSYLSGNFYTSNFNISNNEENIEEEDEHFFDENVLEIPFFNLDIDALSEIDIFGQLLFNYFLFCFLLSGLILLVAMLGAILLTFDFKNSSLQKKEYIFRQLSRSNTCLSYLY